MEGRGFWGCLSNDSRWRGTAHSALPPPTPVPPPERPPLVLACPASTRSRSGPPGRDSPVRPRSLQRVTRPSHPLAGRGMRLRGRCLETKSWCFKRGFALGLHFPDPSAAPPRSKISEGNAGKQSLEMGCMSGGKKAPNAQALCSSQINIVFGKCLAVLAPRIFPFS